MGLGVGRSGTARLRSGRPWSIELSVPGHGTRAMTLRRDGDPWPDKGRTGPLPLPRWSDIDRRLLGAGYVRKGTQPPGGATDGLEFEVLSWESGTAAAPGSGWDTPARPPEGPARTVMVALEPAEAGTLRGALDDLAEAEGPPGPDDAVAPLAARFDAIAAPRLFLSADEAARAVPELRRAAGTSRPLPEEARRSLDELAHRVERGRIVPGPWPAVRATLEDALREALARPGADGLAARDELLAMVGRFIDAHREATRADDAEQRRIEARRAGAPTAPE